MNDHRREPTGTRLAIAPAETVADHPEDTALASGEHYNLRLYIAGQISKSITAAANLRRICEEHLIGRYTVEFIDFLVQPQLAAGEQMLAAPTLVSRVPAPLKRIISTLVNAERVLVGLGIQPSTAA